MRHYPPETWDDRQAWDQYTQARIEQGEARDLGGPFDLKKLPEVAEEFRSAEFETVWIPGCGLAVLPNLLARVGLTVFATDFSPVVIDYQRSGAMRLDDLCSDWECEVTSRTATFEEHDLRIPFRPGEVDFILNRRAFQRFSRSDMRTVAEVHAQALRPGGQAIFETLNCQGELRDWLEESLCEAGFTQPFYTLERDFRQALRETEIPHVFILGMPVIPQLDENGDRVERWHDKAWRDEKSEALREIALEFRQRREAEAEAERAKIGPETRLANVIYSTG